MLPWSQGKVLYLAREGEAASAREQASVGRGKAERFPLQGGSGKAKPERSLLPFACILPALSGREPKEKIVYKDNQENKIKKCFPQPE